MKIILEEKDVIELLSKALNTTLDPQRVHIKTDPFEITVMEAAKVLAANSENKEEKKTEPEEPREEMTDEDVAALMGVSDQIVKVGIPVVASDATDLRTIVTPPPTVDGREV